MLTEEQIKFLNEICPNRWAEENDVINVNRNIDIFYKKLTQMTVQFGQVTGYFSCHNNQLTSLEGVPFRVGNYFNCQYNYLTSLYGCTKEVGTVYSCSNNLLTNLIGAPEICNDNFYCHHNQLTSLEGCPKIIKGDLYCYNNPELNILYGIGRVEGKVAYDNENEINEWIIECMKRDIIFPHFTLEENINWIKDTRQYSCLLRAPEEIRQNFSSKILHLIDSGIC